MPRILLVPNEEARLVPLKDCYFNDAPWLLSRIKREHIHIANSKLSFQACEKLSIRRLSQVIREELHPKFNATTISNPIQSTLTTIINSKEFASGVYAIIRQMRSYWSLDFNYLNTLNEIIIKSLLAGYKVQLIESLSTCFIFVPSKQDITLTSEGTIAFVHESKRIIFISRLPSTITLDQVLAREISKILKLPIVLPLGPLLTSSSPQDISSTLQLLQLATNTTDSSNRGVPGALLVDIDKQMVKYSPFHSFLPNEIVAWENEHKELRYGIIMSDKMKEKSNLLEKIPVKISPHDVTMMPTTKIFVFKNMQNPSKQENSKNEENEEKQEISSANSMPVSEMEYLEAIKDLLQKVNIPLDLNQEQLMQQTLSLQAKLKETETSIKKLQKTSSEMEREIEDAKQATVCPICKEEEIAICLVSCGHTVCESCAKTWQQKSNNVKCPYCRSDVIQFVKMYKP